MKITSTTIIMFSPTGTSRKVATAVADGCRCASHVVDTTHSIPDGLTFDRDSLVFMAVPVYGGKVAPTALQRCEGMKGDATPIVLMVVYGNRDYEGAMEQLAHFVSERGFVPVAAGAFVGEHSYSTSSTPIAVGRPDAQDLSDARAWGRLVREKIDGMTTVEAVNVANMKRPDNSPLSVLKFVQFVMKQRAVKSDVKPVPETDAELCRRCGKCVRMCPTAAIDPRDCMLTDAQRCIKCCACVKGCPVKARTFASPYAPILSECFDKRHSPITLL